MTLTETIERFYLTNPPHATNGAQQDWMRSHPLPGMVLKWVGTGRRVLDLACHKGELTGHLQRAGNDVVGVDLAALTRLDNGGDFPRVAADLTQPFPFRDARFDAVIASSILDYIPGDLEFLRECARVLRPGGVLVVNVPNAVSWVRRVMAIAGRLPRDYRRSDGYHTLHYYTLEGISTLVSVAGLTVVARAKCPRVHSALPFRPWLERLLPTAFADDLMIKAVKDVPDASGGHGTVERAK